MQGVLAVLPPGTPQAGDGGGANDTGVLLLPRAQGHLEARGAPWFAPTPGTWETRSHIESWLPGVGLAVGRGRQSPKSSAICTQWSLGSKGLTGPAMEAGFPRGVIPNFQGLPLPSTQGLGDSMGTNAEEGGEGWPSSEGAPTGAQPWPCPTPEQVAGSLWVSGPDSLPSGEQAAGMTVTH